jgi:hypothetical protein
MAYDLTWHIPQRVLYLRLSAEPTLSEFEAINRTVLERLNQQNRTAFLIIDVTEFHPNTLVWDRIRGSQQYVSHTGLEYVLVVGQKHNRVMRLMMLVLFNLSKAGLKFFESLDEANVFLNNLLGT